MRLIPIFWTILNLVESSPSELVDPNCPWVRLNGLLRRLTTFLAITTWVWYAWQNVTANICNVPRPEAPLIVWWNVIVLGLPVVTVSTLLVFLSSNYSTSACPCHTDCINGCRGCDNLVCFCNVSRKHQ